MCQYCQLKFALCNLKFLSFLNVLDVWDVRLEISVVSIHVNLNLLCVHVKNRKMENRSVHRFSLTRLNKSIGKMCGRKIAKHRQMMKFCHSHLTHTFFNYRMRRFFFGLV